MDEKYFIGDLERQQFRKEISPAHYKELDHCHQVVLGTLDIEHRYALLLDNFKELELELLRYALEHALHSRAKWTDFAEERLILDRRILNVLAASKAYTDQTCTTISRVYGRGSKEYKAFTEAIKIMETSDIEYIFGSGLRNYAQHQHMPVYIESVSFNVVRRAPFQSACTVIPRIKREVLLRGLRDKNVTAKFKKVVSAMPDEIDLKPRIRGFVRSLSSLHLKMREATADATKTAVDVWKGIRNECKAFGCDQFISALATPSDDPGIALKYLAFMADPLKHLGELQEYNSSGRKIGDHFVTSQDEDKMLRDLAPPRS
ncbi:MAG: hypothetical protein ACLQGU_10570 [bacterium]